MKLIWNAIIVCIMLCLCNCSMVKSYDRELLADPIMSGDNSFSKQPIEQKFFSTQEGSSGGSAGVSGGCGCAK